MAKKNGKDTERSGPLDAQELGAEGINMNGAATRTPERSARQTHTEFEFVGAGKHDDNFDEHPDIYELPCDIANAPARTSRKTKR